MKRLSFYLVLLTILAVGQSAWAQGLARKAYPNDGESVIRMANIIKPRKASTFVNAAPRIASGRMFADAPMKVADGTDPVTVYGCMVFSNQWTLTQPPIGIYSIETTSNGTLDPYKLSPFYEANGGGTYVNGKLYFYYYFEVMGGIFAYWRVIDTDAWETVYSSRTSDNKVATDMTFDRVSEQMFGSFVDLRTGEYSFGTVNPANGDVTVLAPLAEPFFGLAADVNGDLYAITYNGYLNKVSKEDGSLTPVGKTGLNPAYMQSMTFDLKTNRLLWAASTKSGCGLYDVNIETGAATLITPFPYDEELSALYTLSQGAAKAAPGDLTDYSAEYVIGTASDIAISFKMPTVAFDGSTLSGNMDWTIRLNDVDTEMGSAAPGEQVNVTIHNAPAGMTVISAFASNDAGQGPQSKVRTYVGVDLPKAPSNIVTKVEGDIITLTWDAPTEGINGGYFDPATLNYRIIRNPGNYTVCNSTKETTFSEQVDATRLTSYSYEITSFSGANRGATASADRVLVGDAFSIPYSDDFTNGNDYTLYTIVDANQDGRTWQWSDQAVRGYYSYDNAMDDWLITPPMILSDAMVYTLRLMTRTTGYSEDIEVFVGKAPNVEAMTEKIMPVTSINSNNYTEFKHEFTVSEPDVYYIGFHLVSPAGHNILYFNSLEVLEAASVKAPAAITDLTAKAAADASLKATVSFTAPDKTVNGEPITALEKIYLYREDRIAKTITNPEPGKKYTEEIANCTRGVNTFRVVAFNADGKGLESKTSVFVGPDLPGRCNNITLMEENGQCVLTWEPPTEGANGGVVDPTKLRYHIASQDFNTGGAYAEAMDLTECRFTQMPNIEGVQGLVAYYVYAVNEYGVGDGYRSNVLVVGTPYQLPFVESFANNTLHYNTFRNEMYAGSESMWGVVESGTFPNVLPADNDGGMLTFQPGDEGGAKSLFTSGRIDISKALKPTFEFWYYFKRLSTDKITVTIATNGRDFNPVGEPIEMQNVSGYSRWVKVSVPLESFKAAGADHIQFGLLVECGDDLSSLHFDNFVVRDMPDNDMAVTAFTVPTKFPVGEKANFAVGVTNMGSNKVDSYRVALFRNGTEIASANGGALEPDGIAEHIFTETPDRSLGEKAEYYAQVFLTGDQVASNDKSTARILTIEYPNFPLVSDLSGYIDPATNTAKLSWSAPDLESGVRTEDNFEAYEAFSIRNFGDWYTVDQDRAATIYIEGVNLWPNCTAPQAWMVFNARLAGLDEPYSDGSPSIFTAHSGEQMLISFAADINDTEHNDDWLISPALNGKAQTVSFYIKSLTDYYGNETWEFLTSSARYRETITAFTKMEGVGGQATEEWQKVTVDLPEGTRYFAIRCTSTDCYGLCVDDIEYTPAPIADLKLLGYDVYCNNTKLNSKVLTETSFDHAGVDPDGAYAYNVVCVYDKGDSANSNTLNLGKAGLDETLGSDIKVSAAAGVIVIEGAAGNTCSVHNAVGMTLVTAECAATTVVEVPAGIYLVTVGGKAFKVLVK